MNTVNMVFHGTNNSFYNFSKTVMSSYIANAMFIGRRGENAAPRFWVYDLNIVNVYLKENI